MDLYSIFDEMDRKNIKNLLLEIQKIIKHNIGENNYFDIDLLIYILKQKKIEFDENKIHVALYMLLNDFGNIIRYDNWSVKPKFQVLDERHENTNWQKSFYNFTDDSVGDKEFLLMADTHIGNDKMQNFKLINNIYDFSLKNKIKNIFHLGDIFEGIKCSDSESEKMKKVEEQLTIFIKNYPNLNPNELRTISLLGNHDKTIHGSYGTDVIVDFKNIKQQLYDLRNITKENPGFILYPRKRMAIELNDIPIKLSHRIFINEFHRDIKFKINEDIIEKTKDSLCQFPLYISGHLHKKVILESEDKYSNKQLFVGVPSTSSLNLDDAVAYVIKLYNNYQTKNIEITILYATPNSDIKIGETCQHEIDLKNKVLIRK